MEGTGSATEKDPLFAESDLQRWCRECYHEAVQPGKAISTERGKRSRGSTSQVFADGKVFSF